jgi:hypothetical protein
MSENWLTGTTHITSSFFATGLYNLPGLPFTNSQTVPNIPMEPHVLEETAWEPPLLENTRSKRRVELDDEDI